MTLSLTKGASLSGTIGGLDSLLVLRRLFPTWPVSMSPALRVIIAALATLDLDTARSSP
jgi:hypothetical protein